MLRAARSIGAVGVARHEVKPFTDKQIELVATFADQAAIAIENVRLFDEIQDKSRQLAEASQHKSQFLANMSHELRTPLNAILGYTELILDDVYGDTPDKMRATLERVQRNGRHLLGLINDVLDLSKIEAGQLTLSIGDYSLRQVVHDVFGAVESLAAEKHIGFKVEMPTELPQGRGDERRLTQVLLNLVGNAIKFTDQGEVVIEASAANGAFKVAVRDTGPGISQADQGKIFEEFQQADNSTTKTEGRHRPRPGDRAAHHGNARRPAVGRIRGGRGLDVHVHASGPGRTASEAGMNKMHSWWSRTRRTTGRSCATCCPAPTTRWSRPRTARRRSTPWPRSKPDLILMDIQLPVMDGYEATRRIKANPDWKAIPIIVVTSYALSGDAEKARAAGCDDYVTKPYSPRQLLAKIREYLK